MLNTLYLWIVLGTTLLFLLRHRVWYRQWQRWRWRQRLHLKKHAALFHKLYADVDGFYLSKQARQGRDAIAYTYGEIEFDSFIALLSCVPLTQNSVFLDLGSGVGKAVVACALVFPVCTSTGIELFTPLVDCASMQKQRLASFPDGVEVAQRVHFMQGDFLKADLPMATVIFINATTILSPAWEDLVKRLEQLPLLETLITTTKPCSSTYFSVIRQTPVSMSWGTVMAYIHERKR